MWFEKLTNIEYFLPDDFRRVQAPRPWPPRANVQAFINYNALISNLDNCSSSITAVTVFNVFIFQARIRKFVSFLFFAIFLNWARPPSRLDLIFVVCLLRSFRPPFFSLSVGKRYGFETVMFTCRRVPPPRFILYARVVFWDANRLPVLVLLCDISAVGTAAIFVLVSFVPMFACILLGT